jgi:multicomponent Na+:H+ antiporter subunit B
MSRIFKTIASVSFPFVMIYGIYIIAHGHLTPGGGFQGGAIVASGCAMIVIAYGSVWTIKALKERHLSINQTLESIGAIAFVGLAFIGIFLADRQFFDNFIFGENGLGLIFNNPAIGVADINTAGVLPLMNFAVGLKVVAGLFGIVLLMAYASTLREEDK